MRSSDDQGSSQCWTKEEKHKLLKALKLHGSRNIKKIKSMLDNMKTEQQIKDAINHYKHISISKTKKKAKHLVNTRKVKIQSNVPLANWANHLTDTLDYKDLETETSQTLRLIADFDELPRPSCAEQIDFRKIYHILADATEGKPLPDDIFINEALNKCALETILLGKSFIKPATFHFLINSLKVNKHDSVNFVPRPTHSHDVMTLRQLASQRSYNPFNIPETYLKPTNISQSSDDTSKEPSDELIDENNELEKYDNVYTVNM